MRWLWVLLFMAACGGGGGGGPPAPLEQGVILGVVRADAPTSINVAIANPLEADASVEELGGAGVPFAPAAGLLPGAVGDGEDFTLRIVFTPPAPGPHSGEIRLRFKAGKQEREVVVRLTANVETPALALLTPVASFPDTLVGEERTLDVSVRNPTLLTPVAMTGISAPPAGFTTTFQPRTVFPGETVTFHVAYAPVAPGDHDFFLSIATGAGPALNVRVTAGSDTWVAEQVTDFGDVSLSAGQSDWLEVLVPPDAISLSIEAVSGSTGAVPGLYGFEGPGGKVYENDTTTGLFLQQIASEGVFSATLPNTDDPNIQLVPGGGTYRFRLFLFGGFTLSLKVRAIVENRPLAVAAESRIDLNVFLAPGLGIASPGTDSTLQAVLGRVDDIFQQQGLALGDVDYYQLSNANYNSVSGSEFPALCAESSVAAQVRMNVFFVQIALGSGTLGVAAALPGPKRNGTRVSGVMVDYDWSNDPAAVGQVVAHEIGHYLGLYHTAESTAGQHDIILDTLECPASGTNAVCTTPGGGYLMHWQYVGASLPVVTDGQALVILGHPLVDPDPSGLSALAQKKAPSPAWVELPPGFCATCAQHK